MFHNVAEGECDALQKVGEHVTEDQLHDMLAEVDLSKNAQVDVGEFLQVMPCVPFPVG